MRIVDPDDRKDFYDGVQIPGTGDHLTYLRKVREVEQKGETFAHIKPADLGTRTVSRWNHVGVSRGRSGIIGFCGKLYAYVELVWTGEKMVNVPDGLGGTVKRLESRHRYCYDIADVDDFVRKYATTKEWEKYRIRRKPANWVGATWFTRAPFVAYFKYGAEIRDKHLQMFIDFDAPIFAWKGPDKWDRYGDDDGSITVNPILGGDRFGPVFDPYLACQELQMWLGNQALPENEMATVPDEIRHEYHGFNEHSFRDETPGKKARRRARAARRKLEREQKRRAS